MRRIFLGVITMALLVGACSTSIEDATAAYCEDLETFLNLFIGDTIQPTSSVDDLKDFASDVESAYNDVVSSAKDVDDAVTSEIEAANAEFEKAVNSISGDATVGEAFQQYADARDAYSMAVGEALDTVVCSSDSTG